MVKYKDGPEGYLYHITAIGYMYLYAVNSSYYMPYNSRFVIPLLGDLPWVFLRDDNDVPRGNGFLDCRTAVRRANHLVT
jgi:hypothetical protein